MPVCHSLQHLPVCSHLKQHLHSCFCAFFFFFLLSSTLAAEQQSCNKTGLLIQVLGFLSTFSKCQVLQQHRFSDNLFKTTCVLTHFEYYMCLSYQHFLLQVGVNANVCVKGRRDINLTVFFSEMLISFCRTLHCHFPSSDKAYQDHSGIRSLLGWVTCCLTKPDQVQMFVI